jgi:diacylglycerol kinase (ATP)
VRYCPSWFGEGDVALVIVNPVSGLRRDTTKMQAILDRLCSALGDPILRYTDQRGHAKELAREGALAGESPIVSVGGDGTFSEVADGVLAAGQESIAVGVIDWGTGGDFRRSLGIGDGFDNALEALISGRERLIDVGRARYRDTQGHPTERYFVNVLSAGLGGLVDRHIERMPRFLGGRIGYYLAALTAVALSREQPVQASVEWDGQVREQTIPAYLIAICNGRWFGAGMDVAPMASLDDARLEVITVTARNRLHLADRVRGVYTGRHLLEPTVHHFPCRTIVLRIDEPGANQHFLLDIDGEGIGSLPVEIEVVPKRLRVLG